MLAEWISQGWWSYPVLTATIAGSAVLPPVPSESAMVTAMSVAAAGELNLVLVCVASALGSALGDLLAYGFGRGVSGQARRRAAGSKRGQAALRWVEEHEEDWGPGLIVVGRFIPGGTTAVGVSAGILSYPMPRFAVFAAIGATLWAVYGLGLAVLGQAAFPGNMWASTALAVALVFVLSGVVHLWRVRKRGDDR